LDNPEPIWHLRILELKEQHGILKAQKIVAKEKLLWQIDNANTLDDIKLVVKSLIEQTTLF
jgi:hypothetical protein